MEDKEKQLQLIYEKVSQLDDRLSDMSSSQKGLKNGYQKQQEVLKGILDTMDKNAERMKKYKAYTDEE